MKEVVTEVNARLQTKVYYDGWWRDKLGEDLWPVYEDFKVFLTMVWDHIGLPAPTPAQYRIADFLQAKGVDLPVTGRADILMAFRGLGKSFISAAFALWRLLRDPRDEKILVISASGKKAKEFVYQLKTIMETMSLLAHLRPTGGCRDQSDNFDVTGASISQSPSVIAKGITGQITGSRATLIIPDDIETPETCGTEDGRETTLTKLLELDAIAVTAVFDEDGRCLQRKGDVVFLGTPQSMDSIYHRMMRERGYGCLCMPARVPQPDTLAENYTIRRNDGSALEILDPWILEGLEADRLTHGSPVDPERFTESDLQSRESKGRSWFMLQYMLDTALSDASKYPLKQNDLIVMPLNETKAPMTIQWGKNTNADNLVADIPNLGFTGDRLMRPMFVDPEWREYERSVCFVDPSGRGKDESAWVVAKTRGASIFVLQCRGFNGETDAAMREMAKDCAKFGVSKLAVEPNFAGGVWITAARPIFRMLAPAVGLEEAKWATAQKEQRIIDTLEPVMNQHKLVFDEAILRADSGCEVNSRVYSLLYQMSHITRDRGSLRHDDRLDALAGAVSWLQNAIGKDQEEEAAATREAELEAMLEDFVEMCKAGPKGRKFRGRRNGRHDPDLEVRQVSL